MCLISVLGCACDSATKQNPAANDKPIVEAAKPTQPAPKPAEPIVPTKPQQATEPKFSRHVSKAGKFSAEFPSKPEERAQGPMTLVAAEFGTTASDTRAALCGVGFMTLPAGAAPKEVTKNALARHRESGKIIEERELEIAGHDARSLIVETEQHRKWMRVVVVGQRMYIMNCGGPFDRAAADGPIALRVLDSFQLEK